MSSSNVTIISQSDSLLRPWQLDIRKFQGFRYLEFEIELIHESLPGFSCQLVNITSNGWHDLFNILNTFMRDKVDNDEGLFYLPRDQHKIKLACQQIFSEIYVKVC